MLAEVPERPRPPALCSRRGRLRPDCSRVRTSTSRSACGRSSTRAAPSRSSAARRCCPRCARRWTRPRRKYVHLDELTEAVGARLAVLTGAEWGLVTNGCSAGLTLATAACVAGGNPDLHVRLPNLSGFAKDEAIIPTHSRNVYDAALRAVGVRVVEVSTLAEFEAALGPRTAMIYILAGPNADDSPLSVKAIAPIAKREGRADPRRCGGRDPDRPERAPAERRDARRLQRRQVPARTADRRPAARAQGPRARGLGPQRAASRLRARPQGREGRRHRHADGGRDVGEARPRRRVEALDRLARSHRAARVARSPASRRPSSQPNGLSNRTPSLRILWDRQKLGLTGDAVVRALFEGEPRIALVRGAAAASPTAGMTGVSVTPYMMAAGDEKIVADRLHALLSKPPAQPATSSPAAPAADLSRPVERAASSSPRRRRRTRCT